MFAPLPEIQRGDSWDNNEVVVVGRVELVPALKPGEQVVTGQYAMFRDRIELVTSEQPKKLDAVQPKDQKNHIVPLLGETFFVRAPYRSFYIPAVALYLKKSNLQSTQSNVNLGVTIRTTNVREQTVMLFPAGFRIDARPSDRAVYIGTIVYHRDEYFGITKVIIRDDFERANAEFRKRTGNTVTLRKALVAVSR